jgi:hypothetical protein
LNVHWVTVGLLDELLIPPPWSDAAVFPVKVQWVTVGLLF